MSDRPRVSGHSRGGGRESASEPYCARGHEELLVRIAESGPCGGAGQPAGFAGRGRSRRCGGRAAARGGRPEPPRIEESAQQKREPARPGKHVLDASSASSRKRAHPSTSTPKRGQAREVLQREQGQAGAHTSATAKES